MMTSENQTQIFDSATDGGIMPDESLVQGARFRRLKNISVAMLKKQADCPDRGHKIRQIHFGIGYFAEGRPAPVD
jgi:hypothetical protein